MSEGLEPEGIHDVNDWLRDHQLGMVTHDTCVLLSNDAGSLTLISQSPKSVDALRPGGPSWEAGSFALL